MAQPKREPKFWKPGLSGPTSSSNFDLRESSTGAGSFVVYNDNVRLSIRNQRQRLPVFQYRNNILHIVQKYQTSIIVGETGCGKSTQIPQYLYESNWASNNQLIAVIQPRNIAVLKIAERLAEEMSCLVGSEVAYATYHEDCRSDQTKIMVMTDDYLIKEMMTNPLLTQYSVIMLDEVHERTINTEIVLGLIKKILKKRKDLRVIVSSATMDAEKFYKHSTSRSKPSDTDENLACILSIEQRTFAVDVFYSQSPFPDYVKASVETVMEIHKTEPPGDILVFLTGEREIETAMRLTSDGSSHLHGTNRELMILAMHSGMPVADQLRVFQSSPSGQRKVIYSTNVAEASLTINGISYVVDCGFVKLKAYNPNSGTESLVIVPISKASACQRAGRAGRVKSGKVFRLYSEEEYEKLSRDTCPEMLRSNLARPILQLKALGIDNVLRFNFLARPPAQCMARGLELLNALKALAADCALTEPLGLQMAELPFDPMLARLLMISGDHGCSEEAASIAAMLQLESVFINPYKQRFEAEQARAKFSVYEGDHLTLLNIYRTFCEYGKKGKWCHENFLNYKSLVQADKIRSYIVGVMKKFGILLNSCEDDDEVIRKCLVASFFPNAARFHPSGEYRTIKDNHPLFIHPGSVLAKIRPPKWVIYNQVLLTSKEFMRDVTKIDASWLTELAPHYYEIGTVERDDHL